MTGAMAWLDEVEQHLGAAPTRRHDAGGWDEVERMLGASVPEDYRSFCDRYGACIIHDFLYVSHPRSTELNTLEIFELYSEFLHELCESDDPLDRITRPLMGDGPGGMLLWAHTDIGDYCFLRPDEDGSWKVCVRYQEGEWHESDLTFTDWMLREVHGIDGDCNILKFRDVPPRYAPRA